MRHRLTSHRRGTVAIATVTACLAACSLAPGDPELGRRLYRDGVLASGEVVPAMLPGGLAGGGSELTCASCHRWSGYGSGEGGAYVPPITAPALFADTRLDRAQLFRPLFQDVQPAPVRSHLRGLRDRPAYTKLSLGRAMREGLDPTGRRLRSPMPRFALPDRDLANLIAYLEKLGARADPGVDDTWIRFASVVLPGVDPNAVAAMREVITSFVARKNADIEGARDRPGYSPLYKSDLEPSYRLWSFDLWELEGASATWRSQLETRYREREVFALLGGVGTDA